MADNTLTEQTSTTTIPYPSPSGTPCSLLYKRNSFLDKELVALVATHLPE